MSTPGIQLAPAAATTGVVLIPVKAFGLAKGRLSDALTEAERARLAQQMATHLVQAQENTIVAICCDDEGVSDWATSVGATTIWCPGTDLNGAVQHGLDQVRSAGYRSVAIAHSDLPLATSLHHLLDWAGVTIVPDRHRTGSNVMAIPASIDFRFSYGTNSFHRHVAEAVRHRKGLRIVHDPDLAWDVDSPDDLDMPQANRLTQLLEGSS